VAKGFSQIAGSDYNETYSPVVKPTTIRVVLSHAISAAWPIHQIDVNNVFLNGDIHEDVYMQQPPGFQSYLLISCASFRKLYMASSKRRARGLKSYVLPWNLLVSILLKVITLYLLSSIHLTPFSF